MAISNIWKSPQTTMIGLLAAATTVAGVLQQQGVNVGKIGTGNTVSVIGAVAAALLGLFAQDPGTSSTTQATTTKSSS